MNPHEAVEQEDLFDASIIPSKLAITAMRDSGYKNTAYAIAELIDNAQQAGASTIEVICLEKREQLAQRQRAIISQIGVMDNGEGMSAITLRKSLQFGNGTRLGDRSGIGRFGMGLPNASISQARRVDVWSWQNGPDNALHTHLQVEEIESGDMTIVPDIKHSPAPTEWLQNSDSVSQSGTLVVWSDLDSHRLTWRTAKATLQNTERLAGRIYRRFIMDGSLRIRLLVMRDNKGVEYDKDAAFNDPLYLTPSPIVPKPFDEVAMFDSVHDDPEDIEYEGNKYTVNVRYSVAKPETIEYAGTSERGNTPYGQHAKSNIGVSVMRAGRELMLDHGWCIGYDPRERWWGAEVEFPPALDEIFGVTNNKQSATHFAELATIDWEELADEGEEFRALVKRLKREGDPRGWLLLLSDNIKRNLQVLRKTIKGQGSGARSTRKTRHEKPDDVTETVNRGWKERSKEHPINEDNVDHTKTSLQTIKDDLTGNKNYSDHDAQELVSLIKDSDLRVLFLEQDFPDAYNLFNVEIKGSVTEVTFNRNHPAFDDIFGTVNTADEDINGLEAQEVLDRLQRAINATKILFAGWARYEREAGVDAARNLQKVRFGWGQIAANFLEPED